METLTLENICPYAPYGLMIANKDLKGNIISVYEMEIENNNDKGLLNVINGINQIPILRPLSDLNKPMRHVSYTRNFEPLKSVVIPSEIFKKHWFLSIREDGHFSEDNGDGTCTGFGYKSCRYDIILLLSEWHFDFSGLIKKGIAIDVNTLDVNPYNT